ncbi:hypothetical protein Gpo141_00003188 [Globisporangium polare]
MSVRSSDGRAPTPPQKRSRLGDATSGAGSVPSSNHSSRANTPVNLSENAPKKPNLRVETENLNDEPAATAKVLEADALRCMTCRQNGDEAGLMKCCSCVNMFHAKCVNLPSVPEEGDFFCQWSCFSNFHKRKALAQRGPSGNFSKLAAQIQLVLRDRVKQRSGRDPGPIQGRQRGAQPQSGNANGHDRRPPRPAEESIDVNQMGRDPVDAYGGRFSRRDDPNNSGRLARKARNGRSSSRSPVRDINSYGGHPHNSLGSADTLGALRGGRRSSSRGSNEYSDPNGSLPPAPEGVFSRSNPGSGRNSASPGSFTPSLSSTGGFPIDGSSKVARAGASQSAALPAQQQLPALYNQQAPPPPVSGQLASQSCLPTLHTVDSRHEHDDMNVRQFDQSRGSSSSRDRVDPHGALGAPNGKAAVAAKEADVPWLSPAAFPVGMYDRFKCHADDLNRVFRIDLTPAFVDKSNPLYQSEIDFFFRCFESSDVSLVVKGMASELNPCIWAWPFILESCGSESYFSFDHFQYKKGRDIGSELEYVGELKLSMGDYNLYLEKYINNLVGKEAIVLEDHAKKEPVTILAGDNIIALNTLVIAQSCTKLYRDLKNSFQWDVFAGGIHCLLQYLPERSRKEKFSSPLFHFTFPGARGALCDPGNGTTDTAYQVLVGSLELVIFERMEPRHRDEFIRILRRAGYHAEKKPMLYESHLRALSSAGFVWTTVKIHDGEFIHINKGRMHFWRAVTRASPARSLPNQPCVFLSWEWVYQGVSQRGISNECWFAMKNASLCSGGWAFDPRRAIIEAAKTGVAIVRTGQFLTSRRGGLSQILSFATAAAVAVDAGIVSQRQMQMVLFLESILQCVKTIVDDEYDLALGKDDSEAFGKHFDGEALWKAVDADLASSKVNDLSAYECGICGLELTNIYKQCLGCTAYASACHPNMSFSVFRICLRCHAHPKHHHFKPRLTRGYFGKLLSCEGHTGAPQSVLDPNFRECACLPTQPCAYCSGCQSCSCECHTRFQTRFRFSSPESLDHLRFDVDEVIKFHKQGR